MSDIYKKRKMPIILDTYLLELELHISRIMCYIISTKHVRRKREQEVKVVVEDSNGLGIEAW